MINMTNGSYIDMRFISLELFCCHNFIVFATFTPTPIPTFYRSLILFRSLCVGKTRIGAGVKLRNKNTEPAMYTNFYRLFNYFLLQNLLYYVFQILASPTLLWISHEVFRSESPPARFHPIHPFLWPYPRHPAKPSIWQYHC